MSRYEDGDGDEDFPNQWEFCRANAERALKGKRGRKVLAELREALVNLPEPRLIESAMCTVAPETRKEPDETFNGRTYPNWHNEDLQNLVSEQGEGVCAVGAYLWWQKVKAGADPGEAFAALPTQLPSDGAGLHDTAILAKQQTGMVYLLAWELAYRNDETLGKCTPEERHAKFLAWIDSELAETTTTAA